MTSTLPPTRLSRRCTFDTGNDFPVSVGCPWTHYNLPSLPPSTLLPLSITAVSDLTSPPFRFLFAPTKTLYDFEISEILNYRTYIPTFLPSPTNFYRGPKFGLGFSCLEGRDSSPESSRTITGNRDRTHCPDLLSSPYPVLTLGTLVGVRTKSFKTTLHMSVEGNVVRRTNKE